ncbi:MAG: hypothetical protein WD266_11385 [Balneolales bacterium]
MNTFLLRKVQPLLFPLTLFSLLFALSSCDDNGIVGSNITDDPPLVQSDTVYLPGTESFTITSFSGNQDYFTAGRYNDAVFGDQQIIGMISPSLQTSGIDSVGQSAKGYLKLHIDQVYGDRASTGAFDIVEIERRWRASAWRPDSLPDLSSNKIIGSFEVDNEDSLRIPLDDEWLQRYAGHFNKNASAQRDSVYRQSMFGMAIVPRNDAKILSFEAARTELIIDHSDDEQNGDDEDQGVFRQIMRATANSIEQGSAAAPAGSKIITNNFSNTLRLRFDVDDDFIGTNNISRAELVLYEDTLSMQQDLPSSHRRPQANALYVYLLTEEETERAIIKDPEIELLRNESDHSFRVNLTSYINSNLTGTMDVRDFYLIVRDDNGRIIPTLIHDEHSNTRRPKILITSAKPEIE